MKRDTEGRNCLRLSIIAVRYVDEASENGEIAGSARRSFQLPSQRVTATAAELPLVHQSRNFWVAYGVLAGMEYKGYFAMRK
jgi:hypothetical protein